MTYKEILVLDKNMIMFLAFVAIALGLYGFHTYFSAMTAQKVSFNQEYVIEKLDNLSAIREEEREKEEREREVENQALVEKLTKTLAENTQIMSRIVSNQNLSIFLGVNATQMMEEEGGQIAGFQNAKPIIVQDESSSNKSK